MPSNLLAAATPGSFTLDGGFAEIVARAAGDDGKKAPPSVTMRAYSGGLLYVDGFGGLPVVLDLKGIRTHTSLVPLLLNHDRAQIVGQADKIVIGASTIDLSGTITGNVEDESSPAGHVAMHARNGFKWPVSVGVRNESIDYVDEGSTVRVNGQSFAGPLYVVRVGVLGETSFVGYGADEKATARIAASAAEENMIPFSEWLKAAGFDEATLTDAAKAHLQKQYNDLKAAAAKPPAALPAVNPPAAPDPTEAIRAAAATEVGRISRLNEISASAQSTEFGALTAKEANDLLASAITNKASAEVFEATVNAAMLKKTREERPKVPSPRGSGDAGVDGQVIEAAAALQVLGPIKVEKLYKPEILAAADRMRTMGIQEMLLRAAHANGQMNGVYRITSGNLANVLRAAFPQRDVQASAFSTIDVGGILSNVMNKVALDSFLEVESVWREISSQRPVNDFKEHTSYRLTGAMEYQKLGPGGELKHGTLGEESFGNKAETFGKILGLRREDIINDDLGMLSKVPDHLGRGGALALNTAFWTEWLDDATFFPTDGSDGNYFEGASTVLSLSSLATARQMLREMLDPDGKPLAVNMAGAMLLVPPALETTADELFKSPELRDTTASKARGTTNVLQGRFRPLVSNYLTNDTAWYVILAPNRSMNPIEVVFLNNVQTPTIDRADADFDQLGIQMRGYFDFGVRKQDNRTAIKSKGAA